MIQVGHYLQTRYEDKNCWELVCEVYQNEYGIKLPKLTSASEMIEEGGWTRVIPGGEREGDILVFKTGANKTHVGMVIDPKLGQMLHSQEGVNTCLQRYRSPTWERRLRSIYRHRAMQSRA